MGREKRVKYLLVVRDLPSSKYRNKQKIAIFFSNNGFFITVNYVIVYTKNCCAHYMDVDEVHYPPFEIHLSET